MKKQLLNLCLIGAALMFLGTAFAQNLEHPADTLDAPPARYAIPVRTMEIPSTLDDDMTVDGFDDEAAYGAEQSTLLFNDTGWDSEADFTAVFKVAWSATYIYFFMEITDDVAHEAADGDNTWEFDNMEMFVDVDTAWTESQWTNGADPVPVDIKQFRVNRGALGITEFGLTDPADGWLLVEGTNGSSGWSFECAMPWTAVMASGDLPEDIHTKGIGFDVSGADSDGSDPGPSGARDVQTSWDTELADNPDNAWFHRNVFGLVNLMGLPDAINEVTTESVQAYPNPATDVINLNLDGLTTLTIYNVVGAQVMVVESTGQVDISSLQSGVYFISDNVTTIQFTKR